MVEVQTGRLAERALPVLLAQLFASRHTGALQLAYTAEHDGNVRGRAQIFFRAGYPVDVLLDSRDNRDRLGIILLENDLLDRDRYLRAQSLRPTAGKLIGELMLAARLLDRRALREGLRAQVRRRLHALFYQDHGQFQLFSGAHTRGTCDGESLASDPRRIIYYGARRAYAAARLHAGLQPLRGFDVQLPQSEATEAARWLPSSEQRLAQVLLRGAWSINDLVTGSQIHPQSALAFLYSYMLTQGLQLYSAGSAPRRPVPTTTAIPLTPPYQPSDEPLPPELSPASALGRPVFLRSGQQLPAEIPGAAGQPRSLSLVPLESLGRPAASPSPSPPDVQLHARAEEARSTAAAILEDAAAEATRSRESGGAQRPPSAPAQPPSEAGAMERTWTAPPLRTSLPAARLPTNVPPASPAAGGKAPGPLAGSGPPLSPGSAGSGREARSAAVEGREARSAAVEGRPVSTGSGRPLLVPGGSPTSQRPPSGAAAPSPPSRGSRSSAPGGPSARSGLRLIERFAPGVQRDDPAQRPEPQLQLDDELKLELETPQRQDDER